MLERLSRTRSKLTKPKVLSAGGLVTISLVTGCGSSQKQACSEALDTVKPSVAASTLQRLLRAGQVVGLDANHGAVSGNEETIAPLCATVRGHEEWFRLTGQGLEVHVEQIPHPHLVPEFWATDSSVSVVTRSGKVDLHTPDGVPGMEVTLSNGDGKFIAIGQTSAISG